MFMRKILFNVFWLIPLLFSGYVNSQYCATGGPSSTFDSNIESVTITGENGTSISYTGCPGLIGVENQLAQVVQLSQGESYTLSVKFGTCGGNYAGAGAAWIDFNGDEVYDNATENVGASTGNPGGAPWNAPVLFNFTVPLAAELGATRMRLVQREGGTLPLDPCVGFTWGSAIEFTVNVIIPAPPAPEQDPTAPTCNLGSDLTVPGSPDPGIEWYWQTTSTGTSTANEVDGAFTVFSNGIYYVRAYDPIEDVWSPASSITVTNFPLATTPPAPIAAVSPVCLPGTEITMPGTPDPDVTWYWQGTNVLGTSNALDASDPFAVGATGTYYVAAFDAITGCWSETNGVPVIVNTVIPNAPSVVASEYQYCLSAAVMEIEAVGLSGCSIAINVFSPSWGDCTTWSVTDNDGVVVLSGGTYGNGYNVTETISNALNGPYSMNISGGGCGDNSPQYSISVDGAVVLSGTASSGATINVGPFNCPNNGDLEWYSAASGGDFLGAGPILNALGTSVLPVASSGTFEFYAFNNLGGCFSAGTLVEVVIPNVLVSLGAIAETCTNYANGSFEITDVQCGEAPFTFSVDGGPFGPEPTDLTAGTYSVVVMDDLGEESLPISVVVPVTSTVIPPAPTANPSSFFFCTTDNPMMIEVEEVPAGCPISVNIFSAGWGDGTTWSVTDNDGVVVLSGGPYGNGFNVTQTIPSAANGPYTLTVVSIYGDNTPNYSVSVDGNVVFSGVAPGNQTTVVSPFGCPVGGDIEWYSAAVGGDLLGTGAFIDALGTVVLPIAAVGTFEFYAFANLNGCYSEDAAIVSVNISDVNVDLIPVAVSCNNGNSGTFILDAVACGDAPFTYSIDGGSFGAIPTDLSPGLYEVVVMDDNGDESSVYTLEILDVPAPQNIVLVATTDEEGSFEWVAGALETSWFVEWGVPGFVPGTGNELGSDLVATPEITITGLDGNTTYDVYVAADCGTGSTVGDWELISFTTDCGIYGAPYFETFENNSDTRVCWTNEYEVGTANWTYVTGALGGTITTAYEGALNARFVSQGGTNTPITKLVSPRFDFAGLDSVGLSFAFGQESWGGDQNITRIYVKGAAGTWTQIQEYTQNVNVWTLDTIIISDTVTQIAFEGVNNFGRANVIDDVRFEACNLTPGQDGEVDVCRLDGTIDLNTVITAGETFGEWSFPANSSILNGSIANISTIASGSYDFWYIVKNSCGNADTTIATINIYPPSSAGISGTFTVCLNQPINLFEGLSGNIDLGGTWYDPQDNALPNSQPTASNIPGSFNYDYIVTNGVCPADSSFVEVIVSGTCNFLSLGEEQFAELSVYPNPATDVLNISNPSNLGSLGVEILDMNGRVVFSNASLLVNTDFANINISSFEKGVYTLRLFNEEGFRTFKVVKQ